jgi:hypothetical protein
MGEISRNALSSRDTKKLIRLVQVLTTCPKEEELYRSFLLMSTGGRR